MLMTYDVLISILYSYRPELESMTLSDLADVLNSFQLERSRGQGRAKSFWVADMESDVDILLLLLYYYWKVNSTLGAPGCYHTAVKRKEQHQYQAQFNRASLFCTSFPTLDRLLLVHQTHRQMPAHRASHRR